MKLEEIKIAVDQQKDAGLNIPKSIKGLGRSKLPIERVRKTMMNEIIIQLVIIVVIFTIPFIRDMRAEPQAIYLILMFVVSTITVGYVLKMWGFYRRTNKLQYNSKNTIQIFIFDLKTLLEVYKTAVVAGSVLLPIPMVALILGTSRKTQELYRQLFSLDYTAFQLLLLALTYLLFSYIAYAITVFSSNFMYGSHIKDLESILVEYDE